MTEPAAHIGLDGKTVTNGRGQVNSGATKERALRSPPATPLTMTGTGTVYSFTTMYNVPKGFEDQKPFTIALVRLDEGPMVTAQLTDVEAADVAIGMPVEMVTRKLREDGAEGQIIYGYKFRPLLSVVHGEEAAKA